MASAWRWPITTNCNSVPGFEVVPVEVVEQAIQDHQIALTRSGRCAAAGPNPRRRCRGDRGGDRLFARIIRRGLRLQVEWYAANPNFHPIPAGYGLPWGTPGGTRHPGAAGFRGGIGLGQGPIEDANAAV